MDDFPILLVESAFFPCKIPIVCAYIIGYTMAIRSKLIQLNHIVYGFKDAFL